MHRVVEWWFADSVLVSLSRWQRACSLDDGHAKAVAGPGKLQSRFPLRGSLRLFA